jgi:N-acetylmuramic acid 6-phosphate etherase
VQDEDLSAAPIRYLLTEQPNPASARIDTLPAMDILNIINAEDSKVAGAVATQIPKIARAVDVAVAALERGGRLFYIGAGTSGRLGVLDASECPPTYNVSPDTVQGIIAGGERALARATEATEDDPDVGARDLEQHGFRGSDVLVGLAASGRTPYVIGAVRKARSMGAVTVGVSCTPNSQLSREVDIAIEPLPGPEVIAGSTRMRAGTATKLVLNMISTAVMIRLGHVYRNLMVNVQPKNRKLVDRACRIIADGGEVSYQRAAELLDESGGKVKTAIVMARLGLPREAAEARLVEAKGRIAVALGECAPD